MPDLKITIGSRDFEVFCQPGEEHFLRTAATLLDAEASLLIGQIGRMPDMRMLLMAGLMMADKTAAMEDQMRDLQGRLEEAEAQAARAQTRLEEAQASQAPVEVRVEVPVVPEGLPERLEHLAGEAEALADRIEDAGAARR